MKKLLLLSALTSSLIFASGSVSSLTSVNPTNTLNEQGDFISPIPVSFGLLGGLLQGDAEESEWQNIFGAEIAFECLFSSDIRSQLQYLYYDVDGTTMQQLSANPHFTFYFDDLGDSVEFGAGPHVGVTQIKIGDEDDIIVTYGAGLSIRTDITEHIFIGAEARYEWTTNATLNNTETSFNNTKVFAKLGYNF